ncbi:MAG: flagellar hook-basal body complex protein FliE [Proteobacteria bacterium]|jgi:flagellar hook-basal body complex protein FliE|nr:flagellar hook-basal body complex protein FliE [Pseudomonadota bacterium]
MINNIANAITAYRQAGDNAVNPGMEARAGPAGNSFADFVANFVDSAKTAGVAAESATVQAVNGTADLNEVVTAVASAEIMLETVVTVRDRVIQAYQEILRMPI